MTTSLRFRELESSESPFILITPRWDTDLERYKLSTRTIAENSSTSTKSWRRWRLRLSRTSPKSTPSVLRSLSALQTTDTMTTTERYATNGQDHDSRRRENASPPSTTLRTTTGEARLPRSIVRNHAAPLQVLETSGIRSFVHATNSERTHRRTYLRYAEGTEFEQG